ncbi:MAG: helix-turn-helix domain-containing protein [Candidatus Manganitrophaceae bacterium]
MPQNIFLLQKDAELLGLLEKESLKTGNHSTPSVLGKAHPQGDSSVILINSEREWDRKIEFLQKLRKEDPSFYAIVAPTSLLKKTVKQIRETAQSLGSKPLPPETSVEKFNGHEPNLSELLEKKLGDFVKRVKNCEVKNLYGLLLREFEKPLITFALKETDGNQIQAAQLLGMNRNTLRKKMKELKISIVKKKKQ